MRRNFLKAAAIALAGLFGMNKQAMSTSAIAGEAAKSKSQYLGHTNYMHGDAKAYGMSLARSGSDKKSNRNRYSHNAKLKRRGVC